MKARKITIRVIALLACVAVFAWMATLFNSSTPEWLLIIVMLAVATTFFALFDSIKAVAKGTENKSGQPSKQQRKDAALELKEKQARRANPSDGYQDAIRDIAALLSDDNDEVLWYLSTYQSPDWSWNEYLAELSPKERADINLLDFMILALNAKGFVGINDWKFTLEDFLANSQPAFNYYQLDSSVYSGVIGYDTMQAPHAFQEIKRYLPGGYGLGLIQNDSDSYNVVIAPEHKLKAAADRAACIDELVYIVELGVIEDV